MAEGESSTTAGVGFLSMVPNQIAALVPTFDPSKDDLQVYTQKVSLLLEAWPIGKHTELVTRLILNCSGSAFLKLQLHQKELMVNDRQSVQKLVEILGGHWGQIGLEKRYEYAERALFKCTQKADESADSYLARADIMWTELNSREMKLSDLQAYITLRGSNLSSDDKKKVLVDADAAGSGDLSIDRVGSAIRMLGAGFFQDITGMKRTKLKTYDQATLMAESVDEDENPNDVYAAEDEMLNEDEMIDALLNEGDHDATFVSDFENAASEVIQNDEELAAAFNTYTEARKRLSEKFRYRGFWPVSQSGKTKGHAKGKVKGKFQKGHSSSRKSLEQRILSSRCRICNKVGHWKAECPDRGNRSSLSGASAPTSFVSTDASLPMEFLQVPLDNSGTIDEPQFQLSFVSVAGHEDFKGKLRRSLNLVREMNPPIKFRCRQPLRNDSTSEPLPEPISEDHVLFATHGSHGVVDLGATKTVIGSNHVAELINSLHPKIRNQLSRCPCQVTFRFGNHGTLKSEQALVVPLQGLKLKIAIVPGSTPFLISNTLLRAFEAVIDVEKHVMWSKKFHQEYPLQLTSKGLFLIDLNVLAAKTAHPVSTKPAETHVAETNLPKSSLPPSKIHSVSFQDAQQENIDQSDLADAPVVGSKSLPVPVSIQPSVCSVPAKVQDRSKPIECVNSVSQSSHGVVGRTSAETASFRLRRSCQICHSTLWLRWMSWGWSLEQSTWGRPTRRYGHPTNSGSHGFSSTTRTARKEFTAWCYTTSLSKSSEPRWRGRAFLW